MCVKCVWDTAEDDSLTAEQIDMEYGQNIPAPQVAPSGYIFPISSRQNQSQDFYDIQSPQRMDHNQTLNPNLFSVVSTTPAW